MNEEIKEKYLQAGKIAAKAMKKAGELCTPNRKMLEICEKVEEFIRKEGAENAFPLNVSVNEVAAHYTATVGDQNVLPKEGVVKIDLGVHVDGYIADTAQSFSLGGKEKELIELADQTLRSILASIKPLMEIKEIGNIVEKEVTSKGYNPVRNLSGHSLSHYNLHSGVSIPNYSNATMSEKLQPGKAYAIEPFVTKGTGVIYNDQKSTIFKFTDRNKKINGYEKLLEKMKEFNGLPFTPRWLNDHYEKFEEGILLLVSERVIDAYPVLIEETKNRVAQAEHTILVEEEKIIITTKRD
ncbi:MAG: type II methionyl aminopeptidase [Candidatus Heimdallarchaeota archaeon]|nr:type II methionyl aminopeptidase [Candidatus Heimdallarchaeota archaeon]MCK5048719.1 type II methionyl aminopeptidase [Candidatus Heimdallarchaeota archaeon]